MLIPTLGGESSFALREGLNTCGRSQRSAQIHLDHITVSRLHAEIEVHGNRIQLRDLDAHNGTFVNGRRVVTKILQPGDEIRFGSYPLRLTRAGPQHVNGKQQARTSNGRHPVAPSFTDPANIASAELTWSGPRIGIQPPPWEWQGLLDTGSRGNIGSSEVDGRRRFAHAIADMGRFLVTNQEEGEVYVNCLKAIAQLFRYRMASLLLLNEAGQPEPRSVFPPSARDRELQVSNTLVEKVVREGRALLMREGQRGHLYDSARTKGIRSALVVPLFENGEVLGALYLDQDDTRYPFEERHRHRLQLLANLVAAKIVQTRVRHEMEWAGLIQRTLLNEVPHAPAGYEVAFKLSPSEQVGGDFYETLPLSDGRFLIALGDIAGHGVGAALLMSTLLASIRALASDAASPLGLAERLTDLVADQVKPQGFVTLFMGFLDPRTHRLRYISAGHEQPALFVPGQPATLIDSTGPPIGLSVPVPLEEEELVLPPGALLCVWSDGIPEALRRCAQPPVDFSRERLLEELNDLRDFPPEQIARRVFGEVDVFVNCARSQDDRTMVVLKRQGRDGRRKPAPTRSGSSGRRGAQRRGETRSRRRVRRWRQRGFGGLGV